MTLTIQPSLSIANDRIDDIGTELANLQPLPANPAVGSLLTETHSTAGELPTSGSGNALQFPRAAFDYLASLVTQSAPPSAHAHDAARAMRPIDPLTENPGPSEPQNPTGPVRP